MPITNLPKVNAKAKTHEVVQVTDNHWNVKSGASGIVYHVRLSPIATCSCEWAKYRPEGTACGCSHVQAVFEHRARQNGYRATARPQFQDFDHLHRKTVEVGDGVSFTLRRA